MTTFGAHYEAHTATITLNSKATYFGILKDSELLIIASDCQGIGQVAIYRLVIDKHRRKVSASAIYSFELPRPVNMVESKVKANGDYVLIAAAGSEVYIVDLSLKDSIHSLRVETWRLPIHSILLNLDSVLIASDGIVEVFAIPFSRDFAKLRKVATIDQKGLQPIMLKVTNADLVISLSSRGQVQIFDAAFHVLYREKTSFVLSISNWLVRRQGHYYSTARGELGFIRPGIPVSK